MTLTPMLASGLLVSGGGLSLALYFGSLAVMRQIREPAYLAGFLLVASLRVLLPVLLGLGIPLPRLEGPDLLRFDGVTLLLVGVTYMLFLRSLFPEDVPRLLMQGVLAGCGSVGLLMLVISPAYLSVLTDWSLVLMMLVLLAVGVLSVLLMRRWRDGAGWVALSVVALVAAVLAEEGLQLGGQPGPDPAVETAEGAGLVATGCVLFALGHVFLMGARLNRVYQASQTLSRHVVALNRRLEERVTEASREIHTTREQLEAILSCVPDGVLTLTGDATIDIFGPGAERVFGWRGYEMTGRPAVTLLSPEWGERLIKSIRRFAAEGVLTYTGQGPVEMEGRRRDGTLFPLQCTVTRIDIGGQPVFVAAVRDMSEAQMQARHTAALQASCEGMRQDLALIESCGGVGHCVAEWRDGQWCTRCSDGFLAVWGCDAVSHPETLAGFLAAVAAEDQPDLFRWLDRRDWSCGARLIRVCVNPEEDRIIELSIRRVRDQHGELLRETGIVRLAGVVPAGAGKGEEMMETAGETAGETGGSAVGTDAVRTILLVEDVEVNRRVAVTFLEREGYRVEVASNGLDAVEMAGRGDYDLILMDIRLPDVDGVEATRRIRALPDPVRSAVPVLALTANVFGDDLSRYEAAGMSGVVAKPIRMPQFRTVLGGLLTRRRQQAASGPDWTSLDRLLDEDFLRERQVALGPDSFAVILDLGRRSAGFAAEELEHSVGTAVPAQAEVAKAGHKLAGAASNFGFAALYALGRQVETLCDAGDLDGAVELGRRAADLAHRTGVALDQWLAAGR